MLTTDTLYYYVLDTSIFKQ